MNPKLLQFLTRLETFSTRERVMLLAGLPLVLIAVCEAAVFSPARSGAVASAKQAEVKQGELKSLTDVIASRPVVAPLPAADQLERQRDALLKEVAAGDAVLAAVARPMDWGTVVRATAAGTRGLVLASMRTQPPDVVFSSALIKPPASAASAARPGAKPAAKPAAPAATVPTIYRHRAELTVNGDFTALLGFLQTLQRSPGDLRWERMQLTVTGYPQARVVLGLYTLSSSPDTPFN